MILRRSGGIRLLSFPPGDAEQVTGALAITFFVFPVQLFRSGWMSSVVPSAFLCSPGLKQLFLFAIPSSSFPTHMYRSPSGGCPALQRGCSCLSALRSHCLPFITSLSWLLLHQCFPSSSHTAGLAAHRDPVFHAGFPVKIKGAESGPLGAEEWVVENRSVSWECVSEDI